MNTIFLKVRKRIAEHCEKQSLFEGIVEGDESYFSVRRSRGERGSGESSRTFIFVIYIRNGRIFTDIVSDESKAAFQKIIRDHVSIDRASNPDGWRGKKSLVDLGYPVPFRIHHGQCEFAKGYKHINDIESFWVYAGNHLRQFNGVARHTFYLHLKETEFRFNHQDDGADVYQEVLKLLRENPLSAS